jgi:hypothetical protein
MVVSFRAVVVRRSRPVVSILANTHRRGNLADVVGDNRSREFELTTVICYSAVVV